MTVFSTTLLLYFIWAVRVSYCQESCETSNLTLTNGSLNGSGEVSDKGEVMFTCDPGLYLIYGGETNTTLTCMNGTWIFDISSLTCSDVDYLLCSGLGQTFHQSSQSCFMKKELGQTKSSVDAAASCNEMAAPGWKGRLAIFINQEHFSAVMDSLMASGDLTLGYRRLGMLIGLKSLDAMSGWRWYEGPTDIWVSNFTAADFPNIEMTLRPGTYCTEFRSWQWGMPDRYLFHHCSHSRIICEFVLVAPPPELEQGRCSISNLSYENGTVSTGSSVSTEIISDGESIQFSCKAKHSLKGDVTRGTASAVCKNGTWDQTDELICLEAYDYLMCKRMEGIYSRAIKSCYRIFHIKYDAYKASKFCADKATPGWRGRLAMIPSQEVHDFLFRNAVNLMGSDGWADYTSGAQYFWIGLRRLTGVPNGHWYEGELTLVYNFTHINGILYHNTWNNNLANSRGTLLYAYGDSIPFLFWPARCVNPYKQLCEFVFEGSMPEFRVGDCKISQLITSGGTIEHDFVSDDIIFNRQSVDFVCEKGKALIEYGSVLRTTATCINGTWNSGYNLSCILATDINFCYRIGGAFWEESKSCFQNFDGICSNSDLYRVCQNKATAGWRGRLAVLTSKKLLDHLGSAGILYTKHAFIGLKSLIDKSNIDTYKWYEGPATEIQNFTEIDEVESAFLGSDCSGCAAYTWGKTYGTHKFYQRPCYKKKRSECPGLCEFVYDAPEPAGWPWTCNISQLQFQNGSISGKPLTQIAVDNQIVTFTCDDGKVLAGNVTKISTTAVCKKGTWEPQMTLQCTGGQADHNFCDDLSGHFIDETGSCWLLVYDRVRSEHTESVLDCQEYEKPGWRSRLGILPTRQIFDAVRSKIRIPGTPANAYIGLRCFGDDCLDPSSWKWVEGFNTILGNFSNSTGIPFEFHWYYRYGILKSISTDEQEQISHIGGTTTRYTLCEYVKEEIYFSPFSTSTSTTSSSTITSSTRSTTTTSQTNAVSTASTTSTSITRTTTLSTIRSTTNTLPSSLLTTTSKSADISTTSMGENTTVPVLPTSGTVSRASTSTTASTKTTTVPSTSTASEIGTTTLNKQGSTASTESTTSTGATTSKPALPISSTVDGSRKKMTTATVFSAPDPERPITTTIKSEPLEKQITSFMAAGSIKVNVHAALGAKIGVLSKSTQPEIIKGRRLISEKIQRDIKVCSLMECMARCHHVAGCVSYNYEHSTGVCNLNKYRKSELDPGLFKPAPGFQHGEAYRDEL